jgi:hypothetical protein
LIWVIVLIVAFAVLHLTVAFRCREPEFAYAAASVALLVIVLAPDAQGDPSRLRRAGSRPCAAFAVQPGVPGRLVPRG